MATEQWLRRAIEAGKQYEDLPPRVRQVLPVQDYKAKIKEFCIQRGLGWGDSLASTACTEQEYYEDLVRYYRTHLRLFPYHLEGFVGRVLRITPFRYYTDLLFGVLKEEKSYDQIPNFTAADVVRLVGIGRNEYIATLNKCRARKLLWRVNRGIARELLPDEPLAAEAKPWWRAHTVNLSEAEFRSLGPQELALCQDAATEGGVRVAEVDAGVLGPLVRRGLVYLEVPIRPDDHVSIPPLEGFVSNRDSETSEERGDPLEAVLYSVFVATSPRASIAELHAILQVDLAKLQQAISLACRLGFATRLPHARDGEAATPRTSGATASAAVEVFDLGNEPEALQAPPSPAGAPAEGAAAASLLRGGEGAGDGQAVALVVDAEVTSYLMMGAFSPGLKRHSVSLFEGGRITGADVVAELINELDASVEATQGLDGEMRRLAAYARALSTALRCLEAAGGGRPLELLRKECLAGLAPAAAARVLAHAYAAVVPTAPLPYPPLPLAPHRPGPANFGPTAEAATPWLQLALYEALGAGPPGLVFVAGQRVWRLPPQLRAASHALLWPWDQGAVRAHAVPVVADGTFLLFTLNEYLTRTALLVQPLRLPPGAEWGDVPALDVALPLAESGDGRIDGILAGSGAVVDLPTPPRLKEAVALLGLELALGHLRLVQLGAPAGGPGASSPRGSEPASSAPQSPDRAQPGEEQGPASAVAAEAGGAGARAPAPVAQDTGQPPGSQSPAAGAAGDEDREPAGSGPGKEAGEGWLPLTLLLGLPLVPDMLCSMVCAQAMTARFLGGDARRAHASGQARLQRRLYGLIAEYGACGGGAVGPEGAALAHVAPPFRNFAFDGAATRPLDLTDYVQGVGALCHPGG